MRKRIKTIFLFASFVSFSALMVSAESRVNDQEFRDDEIVCELNVNWQSIGLKDVKTISRISFDDKTLEKKLKLHHIWAEKYENIDTLTSIDFDSWRPLSNYVEVEDVYYKGKLSKTWPSSPNDQSRSINVMPYVLLGDFNLQSRLSVSVDFNGKINDVDFWGAFYPTNNRAYYIYDAHIKVVRQINTDFVRPSEFTKLLSGEVGEFYDIGNHQKGQRGNENIDRYNDGISQMFNHFFKVDFPSKGEVTKLDQHGVPLYSSDSPQKYFSSVNLLTSDRSDLTYSLVCKKGKNVDNQLKKLIRGSNLEKFKLWWNEL